MFKKVYVIIIVLLIVFVGYLGIHRIVYFNDYKTIASLTEDIYQVEQTIVQYQADIKDSKTELDAAKLAVTPSKTGT